MAAPAPARIPVTEAPRPRSVPPLAPRLAEPRPVVRSARWLKLILGALLVLLAFDYGVSEILRSGWLSARFTRRLESAFGRPVEVSNFGFSLVKGPRLEANYVTVGEDPRFGSEYFLRADQLAVGLRWGALLRGRIELGTLSLTNPHLNLVHLPDGEWNLESWLPKPPGNAQAALVTIHESARPQRIEISGGRVDFKAGGEKLPYALTEVQGRVEQAAPGSWQLDLEAQPFRAGAAVQQAGELRLTGAVGGTSSRLRPANLHLDWSDASLSDVLRLARGTDYGIRGLLAVQLAAKTEGTGWLYTSQAELSQLHRWNLPPRADDPEADISADARWVPGKGRLELTQARIETPHSNLRASGKVEWRFDQGLSRIAVKNTQVELTSTGVQLGELLTWYRAFHPGVDDRISLAGMAGIDLEVRGWPPRIEAGSIATQGATLHGAMPVDDFDLGHAAVEFSPTKIVIPEATIASPDGAQKFRVQATVDRHALPRSNWTLDGISRNLQALFAPASALGFNLPHGWVIDGPAQCHLEWKGVLWPAIRRTEGNITLAGLKIRAPFLNHDITKTKATIEITQNALQIKLASADAFATNWSGTLERRNASGGWQFALSANSLDAAEMDRWMNPQRREGLLDRVFPFLTQSPEPVQVPAWLRGNGTIAVNEFTLKPIALHQVRAIAAIAGRNIDLSHAQAEFSGGTLAGSAILELTSQPSYNVKMNFQNVDLRKLSAQTKSLEGLFDGSASGELQINAKGLGRPALLRSMACAGQTQVRKAGLHQIDLAESFLAGERVAGKSTYPNASAHFTCEMGRIHFSSLVFFGKRQSLAASGDIDLQRRMDLELRAVDSRHAKTPSDQKLDPPAMFHVTGTLKAPIIVRVASHKASK